MKGTRWLILLAIVAILGGSTYLYLFEKANAKRRAPDRPAMLPADVNANAIDYEWAQSSGGFASVQVRAKTFRQVRDTPNYDLGGLELRLNQRDHKHYDLIKSASAQFNQAEGRMYSVGAVEITLDVPVDGEPLHPLTSIKTSGVTFDSKTGEAVTDRATQFTFAHGDGKSAGATYDPAAHELRLMHDPEMNLKGDGPNSKPMKVQGGQITYKETGEVVMLTPWSRMMRAETTIDAGVSIVKLKKGKVDTIDSQQARGIEKYPARELHYSAEKLHVVYGEDGRINRINGSGNAKLHEESEGAITDTRSNTADLEFMPREGDSVLHRVVAQGDAMAESQPAPDHNGKTAESRILKSDTIEVLMRPDGREIDQMKTHSPGTLEFVPNAPDERRRILNGEQMTIGYGAKNLLKDFQATHSTTITFPAANSKVKNAAPSKTTSNTLSATFDAKGQLATMKQWDNFTYEEGGRRAKATRATLDQPNNAMDLDTGARIWDASGATDADKIRLMQKTGDYVAEGHVTTSRLPDQNQKKKQSGEMLDGDEPIQGTAPHMTSANHNKLVHYDGGAAMWQGSDRIEAQTIEIDRDKHMLTATGDVKTQFLDQKRERESDPDGGAPKTLKISIPPKSENKLPASVYTVVTSEKMVYTDADRLAHYVGNVVLNRPGLNVKSSELSAFLNPKDSREDGRLNRAIGEGKVEIVESRPDRQRIGHGEHGEYITSDDKVILRGNLADVYDSIKKDESHGTELTYFTTDDRLLITGAPATPVDSRLHRKPRANAHTGNR